MKILRRILDLLALAGRGVLLGSGFTAGFLIVFVASWPIVYTSTKARTDALLVAARVPTADIALENVVRRPREGGWAFFGSLTNRGSTVARRVQLETRFLRSGEVVDVCSSGFEEMVGSGETRFFLFSCGSDSAPLPEHDEYEVVVESTDWP